MNPTCFLGRNRCKQTHIESRCLVRAPDITCTEKDEWPHWRRSRFTVGANTAAGWTLLTRKSRRAESESQGGLLFDHRFIQMSRFHACVGTFCRTSDGLNSNECVLNNVNNVIYFCASFRSFIKRSLDITSRCVNVFKSNIHAKYMWMVSKCVNVSKTYNQKHNRSCIFDIVIAVALSSTKSHCTNIFYN